MIRKQKLELNWIGKDQQPNLEPRILVEDPEKSYGDPHAENMLIHGDNLLALKALEQDFAGKIQCVYIDPPYNTGAAFDHYDDAVEHSTWLSLMRDRLRILWQLLDRRTGSLWISIDDREMPWLRVMIEEMVGRDKFVACNVWQKRYSRENREAIGDAHEYVLVYASDPVQFKSVRNLLPLGKKQRSVYKNPNNDPKGPWRAVSLSAQGYRPNQMYEIVSPITGKTHTPPAGSCWKVIEPRYKELLADGRIYFGKSGDAVPSRIQYLRDIEGIAPWTWWPHEDAGHTHEAKKEAQTLSGKDDPFGTPKPERLLHQVLHIATNPGDLVLDSFLGSGTTAAVAHKMGRRWIGVELGDHCFTHCLPRLNQVCDGTDQGGISETVEWKGGGGFKYYELAPSLLKQDHHGNWIISQEYNADMLAAAMAKHEGFRYSPDPEVYWKQGQSSEKDFIFTTTSFIRVDFLDRLHEEMREDEHLLICCKKFSSACVNRFTSIEVKKIPHMLLGRCEFGRDDYSLNIVNMPRDPDAPDFVPAGPPPTPAKPKRKGPMASDQQGELF